MYVSQKLPDCETKVGNGTTAVPLNQDVLCLDVSEKYHDRSVFGFDVIANSQNSIAKDHHTDQEANVNDMCFSIISTKHCHV